MARKIIEISFSEGWVLAHMNDYEDYPVTYLVKKLETELTGVQVSRVTPAYCRFFLEGQERDSSDSLRTFISAFVEQKLSIAEGLEDIATITVEDAAAPAEEPVKVVEPADPVEEETAPSLEEGLGVLKDFLPEIEGKTKTEGKAKKPPEKQKEKSLPELLKKTLSMRAAVSEKVIGQLHAIEQFTAGLFAMQVHGGTKTAAKKPRAVFLFAGPPGVGKTYLAETVASLMKLPFLRLDMSGFTDDNAAVESFRGIHPSYKSAQAGMVTSFVEENPECVLLFDEIEKAHPHVIQLFLQILEGARCRDAYTDKEVNFEQTVIIMTTNAGRGLYEGSEKTNFSDVSDRMVIEALKKDIDPVSGKPFFPAAITSRLAEGTVIMFNHLEPFALCDIIAGEMEKQLKNYRDDFSLKVTLDKDVAAAVLYSEGGSSDARTLKGAAKSLVDSELLDLMQLGDMSNLRSVAFTLDLEGAEEDARALFVHRKVPEVLLFGADGVAEEYKSGAHYKIKRTDSIEKAKELLRGEIDCVLIDVACGSRAMQYSPRDLEDIDSDGVEFFRYVREYFEELPVYVLNTGKVEGATAASYRSFIRAGARDVISMADADPKALRAELNIICRNALLCRAALSLARANKALSFNCAQIISEDGAHAEIKLASMRLKRNVSAEDSASILANNGKPNVKFSDVIGARDAKETLKEFIEYLKNPREFLARGIRAPRGVLLYGPPGTGKTLLAKAMAGESDVTFIQKNSTEFFKSYVGEGPQAVRDVFRLARKYAPSILFVDEVDAIGRMRTGSEHMHSMEELQNTFLSEMDGFVYDERRPVFVLAATNYSVENEGGSRVLDPAFVRRFDRKIKIELPDTAERAQFIEYYLLRHGIRHIGKDTIENLAMRSIGRSPADLEMVVELAIRNMKGKPLTDRALADALDADRFGEQREWSEDTVRKTSYHEAGHTVVSYLTGKKPTFVTNISRGDYGGYMMHEVDDKKFGFTRQELLDRICCALGGRAAELVFFGEEAGLTTGASGDLASATNTARALLCHYGMDGDSLLSLNESELTGVLGERIYAKMNDILKEQLARAKDILRQNRGKVEALVEALMKKNSLTAKEIAEVLD